MEKNSKPFMVVHAEEMKDTDFTAAKVEQEYHYIQNDGRNTGNDAVNLIIALVTIQGYRSPLDSSLERTLQPFISIASERRELIVPPL